MPRGLPDGAPELAGGGVDGMVEKPRGAGVEGTIGEEMGPDERRGGLGSYVGRLCDGHRRPARDTSGLGDRRHARRRRRLDGLHLRLARFARRQRPPVRSLDELPVDLEHQRRARDDDVPPEAPVEEHGARPVRPSRLDARLALGLDLDEPADELGADEAPVRRRRDDAVLHAIAAVLRFEDHVGGDDGPEPPLAERIDANTDGAIGIGLEEVHGRYAARRSGPLAFRIITQLGGETPPRREARRELVEGGRTNERPEQRAPVEIARPLGGGEGAIRARAR